MSESDKKKEPIPGPGGAGGDSLSFFEDALRELFARRRDFYLQQIRKRLKCSFAGGEGAAGAENSAKGEWIDIESLSRLRGIVGGRFQNLKAKWIAAGFPLREHRGDRAESFELNQAGWIELSNWISAQGYQARLSPENSECLFQIREAGG